MNGIDPRRLVSREQDEDPAIAEDNRLREEFQRKQSVPKPPAPSTEPASKDKTTSGVSYADLAKNMSKTDPAAEQENRWRAEYEKKKQAEAEQNKPRCDSLHTENCPVEVAARETHFAGMTNNGAAGVKLVVADTEHGTQVGVVSGQFGAQNEASIRVLKHESVGSLGGGFSVRGKIEALTAQASVGVHNPDGSTGINHEASAAVASAGLAIEHEGGAMAGGSIGLGAGIGGSVGFKTNDEGKAVVCVQGEVGPVTVNACLPTPLPGNTTH